MTTLEVNSAVAEAIELLRKAKPGSGPCETRQKNRAAAGEILECIPRRDMLKVDEELLAVLSAVA